MMDAVVTPAVMDLVPDQAKGKARVYAKFTPISTLTFGDEQRNRANKD